MKFGSFEAGANQLRIHRVEGGKDSDEWHNAPCCNGIPLNRKAESLRGDSALIFFEVYEWSLRRHFKLYGRNLRRFCGLRRLRDDASQTALAITLAHVT